jgi:opacity protein-like surface antigen
MKRLSVFMISALFAAQAGASNFYVAASAGGVFPSGNSSFAADSSTILFLPTSPGVSLFDLPDVTWKNSYNNGFLLSVAGGYQFTQNWRSDLEFVYQNMRRNISGTYGWREVDTATKNVYATSAGNPITGASSNTNLYSFMTNGYYDFKNQSKWTPSVGAGIGIAWINSGRTVKDNTLNVDDPAVPLVQTAPVSQLSPALSGTAFAWQLKAGVTYAWTEQTSILIQYRLFGTSQFQAGNSSITSNPATVNASVFNIPQHNISGVLTNVIEVGARFNV